MIPSWEIKRELRSLVGRTAELPIELVRRVCFRRWYDLATTKHSRRTPGSIGAAPEAAIYIIFGLRVLNDHMFKRSK